MTPIIIGLIAFIAGAGGTVFLFRVSTKKPDRRQKRKLNCSRKTN